MGLQTQLNDVASDSIPIFLVALIATAITNLRSFVSSFYVSLLNPGGSGGDVVSQVRMYAALPLPFRYKSGTQKKPQTKNEEAPGCVFCLSKLKDGEFVQKLPCCHVFHKHCLDGWLDLLKLNCPLCRSPILSSPTTAASARDHRVDHGRLLLAVR